MLFSKLYLVCFMIRCLTGFKRSPLKQTHCGFRQYMNNEWNAHIILPYFPSKLWSLWTMDQRARILIENPLQTFEIINKTTLFELNSLLFWFQVSNGVGSPPPLSLFFLLRVSEFKRCRIFSKFLQKFPFTVSLNHGFNIHIVNKYFVNIMKEKVCPSCVLV